ncbi:MAG: nitrile hydratase subunit beta, partial [Pseudomonadota bacterium]
MNGPQDVGGRHGFGPIEPESEGTLFHAEWEKRVLGTTIAAASLGYWNIDASRHARESLPPSVYYGSSYYEI